MNKFSQIEIQDLSVSASDKRYLLLCNGQFYEANYCIVELIHSLQNHDNQEEAITSFIKEKQRKYSKEQVDLLIDTYVLPLLSRTSETKKTFLYQKEIFPAKTIDKYSKAFSFLFNKYIMIGTILITAILNIYFIASANNLLRFDNNVNAYTMIGLFIFMLLSSLFHEVGHASACKHYGINHGGIGFGLYLTFPVLYTDVTEVWKLKRRQRCIVNIAGVYFQCLYLIVLLSIYLLTQNGILKYMILMMNLGFIITLNPFFKFDGYWIVSDLLGVPNLRKRSKELLKYLYKIVRKQKVKEKPYLLQINNVEKYFLLIYSIFVNLFMGYYFFYIIPRFVISFAQSFPNEMKQLILYLSNDMTPSFVLIRNIVMQIVFFIFISVFLVNLSRKLLKYVK